MSEPTDNGDDSAPPPDKAGENQNDIPILPAPQESRGTQFRRRIAIPLPKKALLRWLIGLLVVGFGLFGWVAHVTSAAVAFDVMLQHKSPFDLEAGAAGIVLSCFGYFVVPAGIGAIVGALYVRSTQVSGEQLRRREEALRKQIRPAPPNRSQPGSSV
ncbi:hypothetical protein [Mycobacterium intracellulare]|uniref:hypothetical protein n=1 Tax=Mycobacterium intracellulare TaxID=1767 RepID=UPI001042311A|nr:hypothetical protein [Mycobacterium intracellulare]